MRGVYTDYTGLYNKYGHIIEPLANSLKSQAKNFYGQKVRDYAISDIAYPPNELLIDDIVLNTMSALHRVMKFHVIEKPTRYKYAAYVGFWWQRGKPFLCKIPHYEAFPKIDDHIRDSLFTHLCTSLNEIFITEFMLTMIERQQTSGVCVDHGKTFAYMDLEDSLLYFLKYRHYTQQELELFLKGLDTCPLVYSRY